jgi:hypothetical protein
MPQGPMPLDLMPLQQNHQPPFELQLLHLQEEEG